MPLSSKTLQEVIGILRTISTRDVYNEQLCNEAIAMLLYGCDGRDAGDGHRCNFCEKLQGGDVRHKCW